MISRGKSDFAGKVEQRGQGGEGDEKIARARGLRVVRRQPTSLRSMGKPASRIGDQRGKRKSEGDIRRKKFWGALASAVAGAGWGDWHFG
ncbi:MAG: hypothetical protein B6D36_16875 [Planctomycetes bacterium UTPLA1]|nr:MAG: hypothetical protein B6D36_16875 [Planctomycetes bacterium UTPLA1]